MLFGAVVLVVGPAWTALALLYLVAAWAIITGIARIVAAVQLRRALNNEWLLIASGGASVIFGLIKNILLKDRVDICQEKIGSFSMKLTQLRIEMLKNIERRGKSFCLVHVLIIGAYPVKGLTWNNFDPTHVHFSSRQPF